MRTQRKEQGFIIRKGRRFQQDKEDRKKYMSQTQFFKKGESRSAYRSPGSILHVKFKEDIGMIKSRWADYNPETGHLPDIKYNFEQTNNNLKQWGDTHNLNDASFEEVVAESRLQKIPGLDIEKNINLFKILQETSYQLHHRQSSAQILKCVKEYIEFIDINELGSVNSLNIPLVRKKILKQSLINQRIAFILFGFIQVNNLFDVFKSFANNLATYALDNLLLRLAILSQGKQKQIVEILKSQGKQTFLNKGFETIKTNNEIMSDSIAKVSKADDLFYENLRKISKANKTLHVKGQFTAIQQYFAFFLHLSNKATLAPFLSVAPPPYLPAQDFDKYTLVIDILECLCSHNKKSVQSFRPFAQYFLDQMSQYYEIVSYCDAMPNQVNKVINLLDRKKLIKHRLYKHHLDKTKSFNGKDLSRLGRDLNTVVLIDTSLHSNPHNTIVVNEWKGKKSDAQLAELCPVLAMMGLKKLQPQKVIKKLHQKNEQNHRLGLKYQNVGLDLE